MRKAEEQAKLSYIRSANELSAARKAAALQLDASVMSELPPLKMEKARFVTRIEKTDEGSWNENGFDNIYFTVATNPNSPQGPLNKIASGGELARFMLALKVNLARTSSVETMIFDEVDAGIGGATAQAVGERLSVWHGMYRFWLLLIRHRSRPRETTTLRLRNQPMITSRPQRSESFAAMRNAKKSPGCWQVKLFPMKRGLPLRSC